MVVRIEQIVYQSLRVGFWYTKVESRCSSQVTNTSRNGIVHSELDAGRLLVQVFVNPEKQLHCAVRLQKCCQHSVSKAGEEGLIRWCSLQCTP